MVSICDVNFNTFENIEMLHSDIFCIKGKTCNRSIIF